MSIADDDNIL